MNAWTLMTASAALASLVGLTSLLWVLGRLRRLQRAVEARHIALQALERDVRALCAGAKGMGDGIGDIDRRLRQLSERQDNLDLQALDPSGYRQAISLVRRGADVRDLVSACGLSRSEAELLYLLHHQQAPAPRPSTGRRLN